MKYYLTDTYKLEILEAKYNVFESIMAFILPRNN